jgi:dihydrodipicolinate synthase/N-acetylneuraminate lyase
MDLYAIAATQFTEDAKAVDGDAMAANMERLAAAGIRDVLLTGAYGEFTALEDEERLTVLRKVRATGICDRIMACAASTSTEGTARLALTMLDQGADSVMVSPPLATETGSSDVLRHFEFLSRAVGASLVVYNNPVFGHDLEPRQLGEIMAMDGYIGIKQGTPDTPRLIRGIDAIRATGRSISIYIASDLSATTTLAAPVDGLTSTNCWVFPGAFRALVAAATDGDLALMRFIQIALAPYRRALADTGQPAGVKAAMQVRGYQGSRAVRGPYAPVSDDQMAGLSRVLAECDANLASVTAAVEVLA